MSVIVRSIEKYCPEVTIYCWWDVGIQELTNHWENVWSSRMSFSFSGKYPVGHQKKTEQPKLSLRARAWHFDLATLRMALPHTTTVLSDVIFPFILLACFIQYLHLFCFFFFFFLHLHSNHPYSNCQATPFLVARGSTCSLCKLWCKLEFWWHVFFVVII